MGKKRKRAWDYGDNPHIRRKHGEASQTHSQEPWEQAYKRKKRKKRKTAKRR